MKLPYVITWHRKHIPLISASIIRVTDKADESPAACDPVTTLVNSKLSLSAFKYQIISHQLEPVL